MHGSMLYYTIIVHLFRPLLKVDLLHSDIRPREICIDAANNVSRLARVYRSLYDLRMAHLAIPHILLSVCIVHLLYSAEHNTSRQNLVEGLQGLEALHECHYFGARSFRIVYTLAKKWNLPWPEELRNSKLVPKSDPDKPQGTVSPPADPLLVAPNTATTTAGRMGLNVAYPSVGNPNRRESLSMFGPGRMQLATHSATSRPSSVVSSQHFHSPVVGHTPTQTTYNSTLNSSYQYSQSMSSVPANVSAATTSPTTEAGETMFWNPIPGMQGPILPRNNYQQMGTMGLDSVLQSAEMGDRLGRDGFKINEDWRSNHVNGFSSGASGSVYGAQNDQIGAGYMHRGNSNYAQSGAGVTYQQPTHDGQHGHSQEAYDAAWWPNANSSSDQMS